MKAGRSLSPHKSFPVLVEPLSIKAFTGGGKHVMVFRRLCEELEYYNAVSGGYQGTMPQTTELIISIILLVLALILSRQFHAWKIKKAYLRIIEDLKSREAFTPESAIVLPYATRPFLRIGLRDHRPAALKSLVAEHIVGMTEDGRYYILDKRVGKQMTENR